MTFEELVASTATDLDPIRKLMAQMRAEAAAARLAFEEAAREMSARRERAYADAWELPQVPEIVEVYANYVETGPMPDIVSEPSLSEWLGLGEDRAGGGM